MAIIDPDIYVHGVYFYFKKEYVNIKKDITRITALPAS